MTTGISAGKPSNAGIPKSFPEYNPALINAFDSGCSEFGTFDAGMLIYIPAQKRPTLGPKDATSIPACTSASHIWYANEPGSVSACHTRITAETCPRRVRRTARCSCVSILGATRNWSLANSSFACAASFSSAAPRSFALLASRTASESLASDRRFTSVLYLRTNILGNNSPSTPNATNISAATDPHRSKRDSRDGCLTAIYTSRTKPMNTKPVLAIAKCSQNACASSSSVSVAFMTPFLRRGRGSDSLRPVVTLLALLPPPR